MAMLMVASFVSAQNAKFWGFENERQSWHGLIWERNLQDFSAITYQEAVSDLINAFEDKTGKELVPDTENRAGIKVYTNSGRGLETPKELTRAVIQALVERGFEKENLLIVDTHRERLREAGYLPPHSRRESGNQFDGVPVYALESGELKDPDWYYESPLPQEFTTPLGRELLQRTELDPEIARKSHLPDQLLTNVDFWINLPMASNNPAITLNGALVNATLYNVSNGNRFFSSPSNAPVAVAEIAAIPEIQDTWAFSIISMELMQYIAGPAFNSHYTRSENKLWLSVDPVIMDRMLIEKLNKGRLEHGFMPLPSLPGIIEFSLQMDLGYGVKEQAEFIKIGD